MQKILALAGTILCQVLAYLISAAFASTQQVTLIVGVAAFLSAALVIVGSYLAGSAEISYKFTRIIMVVWVVATLVFGIANMEGAAINASTFPPWVVFVGTPVFTAWVRSEDKRNKQNVKSR